MERSNPVTPDAESSGQDAPVASPDVPAPGAPTPDGGPGSFGRVAVAVGLYVGARLLVVAVVAGILVAVGMPLLLGLLVALVVSLPVSLIAFRGLRARLNREIEALTADRRERHEQLRAELRGDADA